jgi:hypothetical protein
MTQKFLLVCGILAALLYAAMNVFVPMQWPDYRSASQTVSELSAIGAPTRPIWVLLGSVYTLLVVGFGYGVWRSARGNRALRIVGGLLIVHGVIALVWPPMHQRAVLAAGGATLTDTLHLVWAFMAVLLMTMEIGFSAAAFGRRFRAYCIATMILLVAGGILTSIDSHGVAANLATPWIGIWERINIAVHLLWLVVMALALWRSRAEAASPALPMRSAA